MKRNEQGFSTPLAMAVVFSLCVLTLSYSMLVAATERKINSYRLSIDSRKEIDLLITKIVDQMQQLTIENNDMEYSPVLEDIQDKYKDLNLQFADISTAINLKFLNTEILESESFSRYLNNCKDNITDYGWVNSKIANKKVIEEIQQDFNNENVAPLVNTLPLYNIHNMDNDFIFAILQYCKISEPEEVLKKLKFLDESGFNKQEIAKILNITENHLFFDFVGFKTIFWECTFDKCDYKVKAVIAAIPDEKANNEIKKYILIEKKILRKGGESC